jgi:hypothetical protein
VTGSDGSQEPRKLRGKELAAHLEAQRRDRVGRQRRIRGGAPFGAGAPAAMPGPTRTRPPGSPPPDKPSAGTPVVRGQYSDLEVSKPTGRRRRPLLTWSSRVAAGLLIVLVIVAIVKAHSSTRLATSCRSPGFALSADSAPVDGKVVYRMTGPAGEYQLVATGSDGTAHDLTPVRRLADCKADGAAAVSLPPGTYSVTLRSLSGAVVPDGSETFSVLGK